MPFTKFPNTADATEPCPPSASWAAANGKIKTAPGFAFGKDNFLQAELESSFLYEDTPDQAKAAEDVKRDMMKPHPMDRLVCGDVGFGKTEVAVRAAFKAV